MRFVAALAGLLFATGAAAHDTVLLHRTPAPAVGAPVAFELTSTGAFPKPETGPKAARLASLAARAGGRPAAVQTGAEGPQALGLLMTPAQAGAAVLGVSFRPRNIDMDDAEVAHYLDEIGAPATILAAHLAQPEPRVMRETYTKNAKAMFCVRRCTGTDATRPFGHTLEFVAVGSGLGSRFRLLANGRPARGQVVAVTNGDGERRPLRTDRSGEVRLPGRITGLVLLSAVILRAPAAPGGRYTSDWASLTLQVPPAR